jgi:ABC-type sugar transport system ATPase subunit
LNAEEAKRLFELVAELKGDGVGIVYISHKMEEIERLADRITVLRDGRLVATENRAQMPLERLIELMVGEKGLKQLAEQSSGATGEVALKVDDLTVIRKHRKVVDALTLEVRAGEVVGLGGLEGSGNSQVLLAVFGAFGRPDGRIRVGDRSRKISSPIDAIASGLALLTSDRKETGLVLGLSVAQNATLAVLRRISPGGWLSRTREAKIAEQARQELKIRAASLDMPVGELSGGNQQKVALAKWIATEASVLMLDEPTRGIDIYAKREIYELIEHWKAQGKAILLISSELPELLSLSDRILVMHRGRIVKELSRRDASASLVLQAAMDAAA